MTDSPLSRLASGPDRRRTVILVMVVIVAGLAAIRLVAANPEVIIPGDPAAYRTRVEAILSGGLPYFDVPFEHLPVMLIPMLAAWTIGGWISQRMYIIAFA
ncbi:MAG: hypothetical protein WB239_14580, partial [Acidimicrobiia bacterium]